MGTEVKFFHEALSNAPTLNGTAGTLITLLDACLVNGFGLVTVDSLVVSGGVATITRAAGLTFSADQVVVVAGATPSGLNGEKRLISVGANTATFDATGISNQTATGTITVKVAPLGWEKSFSGTNVAVYRSTDVTGTRCYLRVDDTAANAPRVVGYKSMTDVNTGTGPFPTTAQVAGGLHWPKSVDSTATARNWVLAGDSKGFYFSVGTDTTGGTSCSNVWFGDVNSAKSGDAYHCSLCGSNTALAGGSTGVSGFDYSYVGGNTTHHYFARNYSQTGGATMHYLASAACRGSSGGGSGSTSTDLNFPNGADNGLYLCQVPVREWSLKVQRGMMPGLYHCAQNAFSAFNHKDIVTGVTSLAGKKLLAVKNSSANYITFFDVTGPWR